MNKLISIALLLSVCFGVDITPEELGFNQCKSVEIQMSPFSLLHGGDLPSFLIRYRNVKITKAEEKLTCESLIINNATELKFTKSSSIDSAKVIIEASNDIVIRGKLTVDPNIDLTLISKNFEAKDTSIKASDLSIKSLNVAIIDSTFACKNLNLGKYDGTETILFDKKSKIIGDDFAFSSVNFYADNIKAYGEIKGKDGFAAFYVNNDILIDELRVNFTSLGANVSKYGEYYQGLIINFVTSDCKLQSTPSAAAGAGSEHDSTSFLSNISRLLGTTNVLIQSRNRLLLNSSIELPSSKYWLKFSSPLIEINADIRGGNLFFYGPSSLEPVNLNISAGGNLHVKNIKFENIFASEPISLPATKYLYSSRSIIVLQSNGVLERVHNFLSDIDVVDVAGDFALQEYTMQASRTFEDAHKDYDSDFDKDLLFYGPFLQRADLVKFIGINMKEDEPHIFDLRAQTIHGEDSKAYIEHVGGLKIVYSDNSNINVNMPGDFTLERFTMKGSIPHQDRLFKQAKSLHVYDITMSDHEELVLSPKTKELYLKKSKGTIKCNHNLDVLEHDIDTSINLKHTSLFNIKKYTIHGRGCSGLANFALDIQKYAKCVQIENLNGGDSVYRLYPKNTELCVKDSAVKISSVRGLKKVINERSVIKYVEGFRPGKILDEYIVRGLKGDQLQNDSLVGYSTKLYIHGTAGLYMSFGGSPVSIYYSFFINLLHTKELYLQESRICAKGFGSLTSLEQDFTSKVFFVAEDPAESSLIDFSLEEFIIRRSSKDFSRKSYELSKFQPELLCKYSSTHLVNRSCNRGINFKNPEGQPINLTLRA